MKTPVMLVLLLPLAAAAQTVYKVPANSQANHIVLTLANASSGSALEGLAVGLVHCPKDIAFTAQNQSVKSIAAGKESEVSFKFDVSREARINAKDTLLFLVSDKSGSTWTKSIVITYTPPVVFALAQNFPNPFNPSTTIEYDLASASKVSLVVYDILGREVRKLVDEVQEAACYAVRFDARTVASGAYIYRLQATPASGGKGFTAVRKLMVLK